MNIDQLPYIVAISSAGNPTAAARQLGVTQQALSKYLNELEAEVGLELFFRSKRRYLPTPAGYAYIQAAQRILDLRSHTRSAVAALGEKSLPRLRIGLTPNRGIEIMTEIYPLFERRYPQTELVITEGYANDLRRLLVKDQLDVVITAASGALPDDCKALEIHREELVLAVPHFHPQVQREAASLDELPYADLHAFQNDIFILPSESSTLHRLIQDYFERQAFTPRMAASLPNIQLQLAMVRSGTRVALLPEHYISTGKGVAFFRLREAPQQTLVFQTQARRDYSEAERYLIWLLICIHLRMGEDAILRDDELRRIRREFGVTEAEVCL